MAFSPSFSSARVRDLAIPQAVPRFDCPALLPTEEESLLTHVSLLESHLLRLDRSLATLAPRIPTDYSEQLQQDLVRMRQYLEETFSAWDGTAQSAFGVAKSLLGLVAKIKRAETAQGLWMLRLAATQFVEVRGHPELILPNRIYQVTTDRGESLKVRFSEEVVKSFFWDRPKALTMDAAERSLEAIGRGFMPGSGRSSSGISYLFDSRGLQVVKIHIVGGATGSVRLFGINDRGILSFVYVTQSGEHDARFLQRSAQITADRYLKLTWK